MTVSVVLRLAVVGAGLWGMVAGVNQVTLGQTTSVAAKPSGNSQRGTVQAVTGNSLTVMSDAGAKISVTVAEGAKILQVAPGSTDLKSAQAITLADIGVGDKVLMTGKAGETPDSISAMRVILMKSGDIAQKRAAEQADWQKRGTGGIVSAVGATGVTVASGAKKIQVKTTSTTVFRRYAPDSVKFEDAQAGTLAQVQPGDQIEVRGAKAQDGLSIEAEEVVSGSFRNLSGTIASVNATNGTVTLKDLTTKKLMTVSITANSDVRKLPAELAARFAARQRGGDAGAPAGVRPSGNAPVGGGTVAGAPPVRAEEQGVGMGAGGRPGGMGPGGPGGYGGAGRSAGMDLSKMLTRLPTATVSELHVGDAVMIVASRAAGGGDAVTAVTVLAGVEPILAATPSGTQAMTLSPWSVGSGAPAEGGGGPQ